MKQIDTFFKQFGAGFFNSFSKNSEKIPEFFQKNQNNQKQNDEEIKTSSIYKYKIFVFFSIVLYFSLFTLSNVFKIPVLYKPDYPNSTNIQNTANFYSSMKEYLEKQFPDLPMLSNIPEKSKKIQFGNNLTQSPTGLENNPLFVSYFQPNVETQKFFYFVCIMSFIFLLSNYFQRKTDQFFNILFWLGILGSIGLVIYYYTLYPVSSLSFQKVNGNLEYKPPNWILIVGILLPILIVVTQFMYGSKNKIMYIFYVLVLLFMFFSIFIYQTNVKSIQEFIFAPSYMISLPSYLFLCLLLWSNDLNVYGFNYLSNLIMGILLGGFITSYYMRGMELFSVQIKKPCANVNQCLEEAKEINKWQLFIQYLYTFFLIFILFFASFFLFYKI